MAIIGSARIDERNKLSGGEAGDQTGKEVSTQEFYVHKLGWYVLRSKDETIRNKLAIAMLRACKNKNIGYDQSQRNTLYTEAQKVGFDTGKVKVKCECDCSALVRVCLAYAGVKVPDFNTSTEKTVIMNTGKFRTINYKSNTQLKAGDILVTKSKGHTAIVCSI